MRTHQIQRAQNNMQAALDKVAEWSEANGFRISQEKTKAMLICRIRSKPENHPDPTKRLNGQILELVNTHRILGLIVDRQLTWRPHIETVKAKCCKRLNLLRHLAGGRSINPAKGIQDVSPIGSGVRKFGLRVSQENTIKKLDPIHNKGLRIALGDICINRTQNLLIDAVHSNREEISKQRTWQ
jgi:hypothetical protein